MLVTATATLLLAGAGARTSAAAATPAATGGFKLLSPAFKDGGLLPADFTCDGSRASPPLEWKNPPAGTRSFALVMHHTPGPGDTHVYWVMYNLPAQTRSLPRSVSGTGSWGINTVNGRPEYTPPCSQGPGLKTYTLTLYALSVEPTLHVPGAAVAMENLLETIKGHTLATSVINVSHSRPGRASTPQAQPPQPEPGQPGGQRRGGEGRPQLSTNGKTVFVLRGNLLLAYDAKTLKPVGRAELPPGERR
jgi:phosphatidylethanolamine-binding protein (PEBP) family uncharacterized protein